MLRALLFAIGLSAALGLSCAGSYQAPPANEYMLSNSVMSMIIAFGPPAVIEISHINEDEKFFVGRNSGPGWDPQSNVDLFSRVDWLYENSNLFLCTTKVDNADEAAAMVLPGTLDRAAYLTTGCNGAPFTLLSAPPSAPLAIQGEFNSFTPDGSLQTYSTVGRVAMAGNAHNSEWGSYLPHVGDGEASIIKITYYDNDAGFFVGQNSGPGNWNVDMWTRTDWIKDTNDAYWYCDTHYNKANESEAMKDGGHDHSKYAEDGCAGYSFSQLFPVLTTPAAFAAIEGAWEDQTDTKVSISTSSFLSVVAEGDPSVIEIDHYDETAQFFVGRNSGPGWSPQGGVDKVDLYSRVDWVQGANGTLYLCNSISDAADSATAMVAPGTLDRAAYLTTGCNTDLGQPFVALTAPPSAPLAIQGEFNTYTPDGTLQTYSSAVRVAMAGNAHNSKWGSYLPYVGDGEASIIQITHYDNVAGFYVGQNSGPGNWNVGMWTRTDWVKDTNDAYWYCDTHYNKANESEAMKDGGHDHSKYDVSAPNGGCNGWPFSQLFPFTPKPPSPPTPPPSPPSPPTPPPIPPTSPPPPPSPPTAPPPPPSLCGCAQHEADHPFAINCEDPAPIRQAYADLKACEVDGEATKAACESVGTEGVMECQQAFFILQAHHDYCPHDTLTYAEEEYVHVWEASCLKCAIERKYDSTLLDCPVVNCDDTSVIDAAYWIVNTTCLAADSTLEYEWGGSFDTPASSYVWVSQPVGESSPYEWADPSMTMAFLPMASSDYAALDDLAGPVGTADLLLQQTCIPKVSGDTVVPSATDCYLFDFTGLGDDDFTVTIDTSGTAHLGIFAQHVPVEFERTIHYLQAQYPPLSDADSVEPIAEVGAPGTHEHRRLQESRGRDNRRKLGALGSCCNNAHQIGAFRSIVAYHDLCDHDDLPYYVEVGLHDYEQSCEDYFCNAVASDYDGTICPSPPPPPAPPMEPSATSCGAVINGTVTNGDFDGDGAFRLADASFTADVWSDIKSWPWNAGRRLDDGEGARRLEVANRVLKKPRRRLRRLLASQKGEKRAGTTFSSLVGKKEGQTMQVHAFLGTDPAHVVGSTAGLRWKTVEVAFSGGQIKSAVAHHDGLRALIQGTTVAGVVDLSGSGKTFPPGLAMTVTFSAETNMDDVRIDFSSPITIVTTGVRPHPTMVAPQSQPPSAARA